MATTVPSHQIAPAGSVAVTGASGFVGRAVTRRIAENGPLVIALSRSEPAGLPTNSRWLSSPDLGSDADWSPSLAGCEVVVHCAARVHVMNDKAKDPLAEFRRTNTAGTLKLASDAARARVKRFVFMSSIKVNGEETRPGAPYRADDPPAPVDPYGISKWEAEEGLFDLAAKTGLEVTVIRPVLVYGPGVRANFASLMNLVARGLPLPFGAIRNLRSMIYVENLADLAATVASHPDVSGKVFLASDGVDLSTPDIIRELARAMGRTPRLVSLPPALLSGMLNLIGRGAMAERLLGSLTVDIAPTRQALGWSPPFDVRAALARTVDATGLTTRS